MKKISRTLLSVVLFFSMNIFCYAQENTYTQNLDDLQNEYNINIDAQDEISLENIFNFLMDMLKENLNEPLRLFYRILSIIILAGILKLFEQKSFESINKVIDTVCVLVIFVSLMPSFSNIIDIVWQNLFDIKNFMLSFLPIFAGISMASGEIITAGVYTGLFLTGFAFISNICVSVILPSLNIFLAVSVTSALVEEMRLDSLIKFYISVVKWFLKGSVSIVCFALSLQTVITQSQDRLAVTLGESVSGLIPVIGSGLQDAVSSVYASMEVIKSFAGFVGVGAVSSIFLPSIILLFIYWFIINALIIVSDLFNTKFSKKLLDGFKNFIELSLSIVFLIFVLLVFSITIMVVLTQGV